MRIRVQSEIPATSPTYYRAKIMEAIEELEDQHRAGEIETPAYFLKKRSLVKML